MYKRVTVNVSKEDMSREVQSALSTLTDIATRLKATTEALRAATDKDINFYTLDQCQNLMDEIGDVDIRGDLKRLLTILMGRAKTRMNEFEAKMAPQKRQRIVSDRAA